MKGDKALARTVQVTITRGLFTFSGHIQSPNGRSYYHVQHHNLIHIKRDASRKKGSYLIRVYNAVCRKV